jgi:hypothetical protein
VRIAVKSRLETFVAGLGRVLATGASRYAMAGSDLQFLDSSALGFRA